MIWEMSEQPGRPLMSVTEVCEPSLVAFAVGEHYSEYILQPSYTNVAML